MKRKNKKNKAILVVALILFITVGYAALTSTLNITGNSEIKSAKWDIHFDNLVVDSSSVEATTPATIEADKTTINYVVRLDKPGDIYSFTVDVVNDGTIDGMINVVSNTGLTEEQQKYVQYVATYTNGNELKEKDGLKAGAKKHIRVSVKYKDDINPEDLPQEEKVINLTFKIDYVQADDTVTPPVAPVMRSYASGGSTDDYHNSKYKSKVTKIVTKTDIDVPKTAIESWDVSAAGDGSVVAYIEDDGSGNGTYNVTICGDGGKVIANEDSSSFFGGFSSLKETDLSNLDTSKVTNMSFMFSSCSSLTSLDLSNLDTSKVTDMKFMFSFCNSLTSLDLSSLDTSNVTNMYSMFRGCGSLASIDLSNLDTSNVTNMESMFENCSNLTSLDVSNFDTSKVTDMYYMFDDCSKLTSLDLSHFNTSKVTNMGAMFGGCSKLTNLNLNGMDFRNLTNNPSDSTRFISYLGIPQQLEKLSLNNAKLATNITSLSHMFNNITSLKDISLVNMEASNVTSMGSMFAGCSSLTSVNLSNFNAGKVTSMSGMFDHCSSLTTVNLNSFNTSNVIDMSGMFNSCSNLETLGASGFDTNKVTSMSGMFAGCTKLTTAITISNPATSSYSGMFSGAATVSGAQITVNYKSTTSDLVDKMIATKNSNSNVVKGANRDGFESLIAGKTKYTMFMSYSTGYYSDKVTYTNGQYTLVNPVAITWEDNYQSLVGKFVYFSPNYSSNTITYIIATSSDKMEYVTLSGGEGARS